MKFLRAAYNGSQQASRDYECNRQTRDVFNQSLEPRDALCSKNEYSDEVWSNTNKTLYKGFAGAKPAARCGWLRRVSGSYIRKRSAAA